MRINRTVGIIFTFINCIAIAVSIVLFLKTDRTKPEFKAIAVQTIYTRDLRQEELLEGIAAYDNMDGDITANIVIEKIIENEEERTAVVVYAVRDESGNVSKFSRQFPAFYGEGSSTEGLKTGEGENTPTTAFAEADGREIMEVLPREGETGDGNIPAKEEAGGRDTPAEEKAADREAAEEEGKNAGREAAEEGEENADREPAEKEEENADREPAEEEEENAGGEPAEEEPETEKEDNDKAAERQRTDIPPVLILKADEIKTQAGSKPPWVNVIRTMTDDKDSYETLFYNLQVSEFDRNTPGNYPVTVYTVDSDGNESVRSSITVVVQ